MVIAYSLRIYFKRHLVGCFCYPPSVIQHLSLFYITNFRRQILHECINVELLFHIFDLIVKWPNTWHFLMYSKWIRYDYLYHTFFFRMAPYIFWLFENNYSSWWITKKLFANASSNEAWHSNWECFGKRSIQN